LFFDTLSWRPLRTSCWIVGNRVSVFPSCSYCQACQARVGSLRACRFPGSTTELENRRFPAVPTRLTCTFSLSSDPRGRVCRARPSADVKHRLTGRQPTPIRIRTTRERVHTASCTATLLGRCDPASRRLLTRRHPRGDGHECKRYHPCARRPNWYWSLARLSTRKPTRLLDRTRTQSAICLVYLTLRPPGPFHPAPARRRRKTGLGGAAGGVPGGRRQEAGGRRPEAGGRRQGG